MSAPTHLACAEYAAGRCRSCTWIDMAYAEQLARKQVAAAAALPTLPATAWLPPCPSPLSEFRNKAKMVVGGTLDAPLLGILDGDQAVLDLTRCPLYPPAIREAFPALIEFIRLARIQPYSVSARSGELKYVLLTAADDGALMLRLVCRSREPLDRIRKHLPALCTALPQLTVATLNLQPIHQAVLEGPEEIDLGLAPALPMLVNGLPLQLPPGAFWQTNRVVLAALYRQAREWSGAACPERVLDLYCGVGAFALHLAQPGTTVLGVDISAAAITGAQQAAQQMGLAQARFAALDATGLDAEVAADWSLIVVNPPRRGLGAALCAKLDRSPAARLLYSSCNVESLARDLQCLPTWRPRRARLFDMFPHTAHGEILIELERAP